ncbi:PLC-like phosphodiesterase [Penicillium chermesinum]|nr:PLC-like phosphodiesterase [Penicillium chermesinum]
MRWSLALALLARVALGEARDHTSDTTSDPTSDDSSTTTIAWSDASIITDPSSVIPTGSYLVYGTTINLSDGDQLTSTITQNASASRTGNGTLYTSTHDSVTVLVGGAGTTTLGNSSMNATATTTATATHTPIVNTRPCNDYVQFCQRSYSNITMVGAHNSPFVQKNNAASNQVLDVTYQLDDGIRFLELQAHDQNGTMYLCHTSCDILNVGTLEAYLTKVASWVKTHPYDVVTILMTNFDYVSPSHFVEPVKNSGLYDYRYTPSKIPMALHDWPVLADLILHQTRLPLHGAASPGLSHKDALNRMYMANHNLNVDLSLGSFNILIPNTAVINETNAVNGTGSLGAMARECTAMWHRPPNVLLVDYYNEGSFNGSVFEVAAQMNNVTYNRTCCGEESAAGHGISAVSLTSLLLIALGTTLFSSF